MRLGGSSRQESGTLPAWQSHNVAPLAWSGFTVHRTAETRYDIMSRKVREWVREGASGPVRTMTEYGYDLAGRPTCTAVRMNPAAFAYTGLPNACAANAPGSEGPDRITRTDHDAAGQRLQLRVGVGSDVEAAEATWAYNDNGQVTTVIDGNGNRAELVYDGHGRQNCWMFPSTARPSNFIDTNQATALASAGSLSGGMTNGHCWSGDYEAYGYDPNGNRTSLRKRDNASHAYGNITYEYDALNRLTRKLVPQRPAPHPNPLDPSHTRDVYYGYDLRGLQTYVRFDGASGQGVTSGYDGFGRPLTSSINLGGTARTLSYLHDRNGNRTRLTHPDLQAFTFQHDGLGRLTHFYQGVGTSVILGQFTYNAQGSLASRIDRPGSSATFTYDPVGRLTGIANVYTGGTSNLTVGLGYNPASQIASQSRNNDAYAWTGHYQVARPYTTNGLNQYSAAGGAGFTYDRNGNLISETTAGVTRSYGYDVENRLVSASGGPSTGSGGTVTLSYDPLGRLHEVAAPSGTTRFLYDGDALVGEYVNQPHTMTNRYVHGAGVDDPLIWYSATATHYLHRDHQGSIVAAAANAGTVVAINRYDEYGIPASTNVGRFQYTGQIWLPELGMYHYKGRIYSPYIGRFLQTDPIGYEDQFNLYAYVRNDPINLVDPTGRAIIHWTSKNEARITINWTADERGGARMEASPSDVNHLINRGLSGSVNFGGDQVNVTTQANYYAPGQTAGVPDLNTLEVYPYGQIPGDSGDGMGGGARPYASLGGSLARANSSESAIVIAHEVGVHTSGGADQYAWGLDIDGSVIRVNYPEPSLAGGGSGNVLTARPNDRMMGQIFRDPNNIVTCAPEAIERCR